MKIKQLRLEKYPGKENPADLLTKVLARDHNLYLLQKLGMSLETGRPEIAPRRLHQEVG